MAATRKLNHDIVESMNIDKILGTMFSHIESSTVFCVCHVQLHRSFHLTIFDGTPIQLFNLKNCK